MTGGPGHGPGPPAAAGRAGAIMASQLPPLRCTVVVAGGRRDRDGPLRCLSGRPEPCRDSDRDWARPAGADGHGADGRALHRRPWGGPASGSLAPRYRVSDVRYRT
jgi:hypothetical protein